MTERPRLTPPMADARRAVRELVASLDLPTGSLVLVACSGGGDSMALAAAAAFELPRAGFSAGAIIVDHQLQSGSNQVAAQAASRCEALGLHPVIVSKVEVALDGLGMEAAARAARYRAFDKALTAEGAQLVLLGHNLEDQAETVLLGLVRGSGLASIAGMDSYDPARRIARPFLALSRSSLRQACVDQGLEYWNDPHNENEQFARVRARRLLAAFDSELGPGIALALTRTADQARAVDDLVSGLAAELLVESRATASGRSISYQVAALAKAHEAVRSKALHLICQRAGANDITAIHIAQIDALITNWHGQKPASLSGITVERVKDLLVFSKSQPPTPGAC